MINYQNLTLHQAKSLLVQLNYYYANHHSHSNLTVSQYILHTKIIVHVEKSLKMFINVLSTSEHISDYNLIYDLKEFYFLSYSQIERLTDIPRGTLGQVMKRFDQRSLKKNQKLVLCNLLFNLQRFRSDKIWFENLIE